ncbi:hypothetical protein BJY00DRAFT_318541 [Aspergillus carlsbadensis]|nr:hypothetical protein BJY00DRAFT_318541 [Aspergillus carlsbadensis]
MKSITATYLLTALSSLASLTNLVSAQGSTGTITIDEAGQFFVGFPAAGGLLDVTGPSDSWTVEVTGPDEFSFTDSNGFQVACADGRGQPCVSSSQGDVFVVETANPDTGTLSIRQRDSDGGLFWTVVGDYVVLHSQGEAGSQEFYFHSGRG